MNNKNISIIASVSLNGVIGNEGKIPWHISEDLKRFKKLTTNQIVILGRRTFNSLPVDLKDRFVIVISKTIKSKDVEGNHCHIDYITPSLENAINIAGEIGNSKPDDIYKEIFLCGGSSIYSEGMIYANKIYLTKVLSLYRGDAFFPYFPVEHDEWELADHERHDGFIFLKYYKDKELKIKCQQ